MLTHGTVSEALENRLGNAITVAPERICFDNALQAQDRPEYWQIFTDRLVATLYNENYQLAPREFKGKVFAKVEEQNFIARHLHGVSRIACVLNELADNRVYWANDFARFEKGKLPYGQLEPIR
jgi:hypothetical protein